MKLPSPDDNLFASAQAYINEHPQEAAEWSANYNQGKADSFWGKIGDALGLTHYAADAASNKTKVNQAYETQATNSARAWDEYMASTQYQRAVKDLQAAGLNPWLALQSGITSQSGGHTAGSGSSARYVSEESKKSSNSLSSIAMLMIACARLFTALA